MAITTDDFNKIWASASPLTPYSFSDSQYKEGWNFIGSTPPARQMWDFLQKQNDEKMQYLANNYLPLNGGTMTGNIQWGVGSNGTHFGIQPSAQGCDFGWWWNELSGAGLGLRNVSHRNSGQFNLWATDGTTTKALVGNPDGSLTWDGQPLLPVGVVQAFAGTTIPSGWLLCDGSAVSRTTYANLYACIGTTYGSGDGSTTFNLPNLVDIFVEGSATAGTVKSAGLPNITGRYHSGGGASQGWLNAVQGVFTGTSNDGTSKNTENPSSGKGDLDVRFDASKSNAIYGNSTTVQPPALTMRYIIKY